MISKDRFNWLPLIIVASAQVLLVFNIATLKISIEGIVTAFDAGSSMVKTAIIMYSLMVAASILGSTRLAIIIGARRMFRASIALFGVAMATMAWSPNATMVLLAQMIAGAAAAVLTPASVQLIATHYAGEQRALALGRLSATRSLSLAPAFLIAGAIATWHDWRITFILLLLLAGGVYFGSLYLRQRPGLLPNTTITSKEIVGLGAVALAMLLIGLGSDNLINWGVVRATAGAPFSPLNLSPALLGMLFGVVLIKLVLVWMAKRHIGGCLGVMQLLNTPGQRSMLWSIFTIAAVSSGVTFLIPLYIEIVQGRSSLVTAYALVPFTVASFIGALSVSRFGSPQSVRNITRHAFLAVGTGLLLLGAIVRNDWSDASVVLSLAAIGLGEGTLATLLFKNLASVAPTEISEDVEPLCSATSHLAAAVGAAIAGALVIGVLSLNVNQHLARDPAIGTELRAHLDLNRVAFISNDRLQQVLEQSLLTPEHIANAVQINTDARLFALKLSFFALAGLTFVGFLPVARSR
ncbi:MFS transporter [Peristeroidobacter agariperforans]|uniref:MFS transporter n=1 Tax=Peristeroidobacter agariperforans TaxID=268404 RepID=UPI001300514C|nr:MFS transporter [Peristeroidobacter agariperforans]